MIELRAMQDGDFAWLLGERPAPANPPAICEGGVAPAEVIELIRGVAAKNREAIGGDVAWLVVADDETVGMISFTRPHDGKRPEIGYGIADSRQGRGHATAAVTALLPIVRARGFDGLTAETGVGNRPSQLVLERNGFLRTGERTDPEDGDLYLWTIGLNDE
ncbi:GNAT family N-acetyltransferase [Sphingomonas pruni]|uniref:GNAT family N-acetyltransferase n=1 Tax=Sphingomonas pruni TaxID=40683 RepID=UPI001FDFC4D3|nr:GNAT family N-acetyltransferase [Sphingomonas pruni]